MRALQIQCFSPKPGSFFDFPLSTPLPHPTQQQILSTLLLKYNQKVRRVSTLGGGVVTWNGILRGWVSSISWARCSLHWVDLFVKLHQTACTWYVYFSVYVCYISLKSSWIHKSLCTPSQPLLQLRPCDLLPATAALSSLGFLLLSHPLQSVFPTAAWASWSMSVQIMQFLCPKHSTVFTSFKTNRTIYPHPTACWPPLLTLGQPHSSSKR